MADELNDVLAAYIAAWAETDPSKRLRLLDTCWSENGQYMDPTGAAQGRQGLADHIGGFHAQMPGARIELTTGASAHHGRIYFKWRLITPSGGVGVEGVDFGTLSADGRIQEIVGFFGSPPTA